MYLEMTADTGVIGIAVFLAIPVLLLRALWAARRRCLASDPELADTAAALFLSITGFLVAALFLSFAYQRYYWLLLALAGAALQIMRRPGRTLATVTAAGGHWRARAGGMAAGAVSRARVGPARGP
jgi:O-antigen ligase